MECEFRKTDLGLIPASDETRAQFSKWKLGDTIRGDFVKPRNPHFHRKFFALVKLAFEYWEEKSPGIEFKGNLIRPDFERFRKDITILSGRYHMVSNINSEVRAEADSISFAQMGEDEFQQLYERVVQVILERVLTDRSREDVERSIEKIMEFA